MSNKMKWLITKLCVIDSQPELFYGMNIMLSYSFRLMSNKFNQWKRYSWSDIRGKKLPRSCQKNEHFCVYAGYGRERKSHNLQHTAEKYCFYVKVDIYWAYIVWGCGSTMVRISEIKVEVVINMWILCCNATFLTNE